jgi:hypothetical protein
LLEFSGGFGSVVELKVGQAADIQHPIGAVDAVLTQFIFSSCFQCRHGVGGLVVMQKIQGLDNGRYGIFHDCVRGIFFGQFREELLGLCGIADEGQGYCRHRAMVDIARQAGSFLPRAFVVAVGSVAHGLAAYGVAAELA